MNWIKKAWDEIEIRQKTVREFGFILTGFFLVVPILVNFIRVFFAHKAVHYWPGWLLFGVLALSINLLAPKVMTCVYHAALFAVQPISWVIMRLALGILFYLVFSPVSIIMRLLGKDFLDEKINRNAPTYWKKHVSPSGTDRYERLF